MTKVVNLGKSPNFGKEGNEKNTKQASHLFCLMGYFPG